MEASQNQEVAHTVPAPEFAGFPKMARWSRDILITEKIDGTNAQIYITDTGEFLVGSRTRWIQPGNDNHGFAKWAYEHKDELMQLGPGRHFGEWWGFGIQRGYGLKEKKFSLFNALRWGPPEANRPACCEVVPILYHGPLDTVVKAPSGDTMIDPVTFAVWTLTVEGSRAARDFMKPEGVVIYHMAAGVGFKKTLEGDESYKGGQRDLDGNIVEAK